MSGERIDLAERLAEAQRDPAMIAAALALQQGRLDMAENGLRERLRADPTDVAAIRMMAELAARLGRYADAEKLLARALEIAPDFHAARANYVTVLHRQSKFTAAHAEADRVIAAEPHDFGHLALKAAVLVRTGGYEEAIALYRRILNKFPDQPRLWISLGHVLKTIGRQDECITAYREAIAQAPSLGDAWWSLANLKTVTLDAADRAAMAAALAEAEATADRYHLYFALGKAYEDAGQWEPAFANYAEGNRLRRVELPYNADRNSEHMRQSCALLTTEAFAARRDGGDQANDPIFVVGLPRSGSTLIEQILASHSQVEGTMELPDIGTIAADLGGRGDGDDDPAGYLPRLLALSPEGRAMLARRYLEGTRVQRKTGRPRFIDKMPNNFQHLGLIHLILPRAVIIDARRDPMATGFSCFKQHFSRGQGFTYDLTDIGRYWRDYAALMRHYDSVLPGRVYRVQHEALVANAEQEIRLLLAHCGLPFEPACLAPHKTDRAVRTASSEQVRQPINADALDHWRHFEPWLDPLKTALDGPPG